MDILVTVGVILLLIALAALMIHLINAHHEQGIAALDYEQSRPGDTSDRTERQSGPASSRHERPGE
jgi:hypothetical protein